MTWLFVAAAVGVAALFVFAEVGGRKNDGRGGPLMR
jgi:hypothetical protein